MRWGGRLGFAADRLLGGCDLFLRSAPSWPPVRSAPTVVPVSELPPAGSAEEAALAERLRGEDAWIVFSAEGERRLVEGLGFPAERVVRLPVGCDHWQRAGDAPPPFPEDPSWLVLGGMRMDREPIRILEAFEALHAEGRVASLTWIGPAGDASEVFSRRLAFAAAREHVRWLEGEDEARMLQRVTDAWLLVHLSRDELTPVTPLEALRSGRAAVVSDLPAFREVLGDRVGYAPPAGGLAGREGLAAVLRERTEAASDLRAARERLSLAGDFTWRRHARRFEADFSDRLTTGRIHSLGSAEVPLAKAFPGHQRSR